MEYQKEKNGKKIYMGEAIDFPCPLELLKSCLTDKANITTLSDIILNVCKGIDLRLIFYK